MKWDIIQLAFCIPGSASTDSTKDRKHLKKIPESSKKQNLNFMCASNYLPSIYSVLGFISNLEQFKGIWEDVHRLYATTTPFYIKNLSIPGFGRGILKPVPFPPAIKREDCTSLISLECCSEEQMR